MTKPDADKWLMRAKDLIVIAAALTPVLVFGARLYRLPDIVEAHAAQIAQHGSRLDKIDASIALLTELVAEKRKREGVR